MDAKSLKNVAIVSVEGAARLGRVTEVLFETNPLRLAALRASDQSGESVLPFDRVSSFGSDAVMVETPDVSQVSRQTDSFTHLRSLADLQTLKVVDESGGFIGTITDIHFDPDSGRVERLVAHTGGMLGVGGKKTTIEGHDVRSVGSDLITISANRTASSET